MGMHFFYNRVLLHITKKKTHCRPIYLLKKNANKNTRDIIKAGGVSVRVCINLYVG